MKILDKLPESSRPDFVRGDWGSDNIMTELEQKRYRYLFKMKKIKQVKALIHEQHNKGDWKYFKKGWEAKEATLKLTTWDNERRVVLVRRQLQTADDLVIEQRKDGHLSLSFIEGVENIKAFEYSVLVTNLDSDIISIVQHYRDRADCENNFDELKNQWGWGGFITQKVKSCQLISRIIALVYNWWTLYVRLLMPNTHLEAITSRPLLLSGVGRLTQTGRQKKISITNTHQLKDKMIDAYNKIILFFNYLKVTAPQLNSRQCWQVILDEIMTLLGINLEHDERCLGNDKLDLLSFSP